MTKREWIELIIEGRRDIPVPQQWMGFFNVDVARKITPEHCHYWPMSLHDKGEDFDTSPMDNDELDKMIQFNEYADRCMTFVGKGANIIFGHGGPGEFMTRIIERSENHFIIEYETGALVKINIHPHFSHSFGRPVKTINDLKKLTLPDPANESRYEGLAHDVKYLKSKGEYVTAPLNGFFSSIHNFFMEYEETLMALLLDPDLIHAIVELVGGWNITAASKMIESGADCIAVCDDLGSRQSLLMQPQLYRKFFKPWHKKLCETVHGKGARVHLHSHGAISPLLDDLADCGFDFINPFDPEEGFDIEGVLKKYSDKFVIVGGFPSNFWTWPEQKQKKHLENMTSLAKKYGRFIFMDSSGVPENVTHEDFERIIKLSRQIRGVENIVGIA